MRTKEISLSFPGEDLLISLLNKSIFQLHLQLRPVTISNAESKFRAACASVVCFSNLSDESLFRPLRSTMHLLSTKIAPLFLLMLSFVAVPQAAAAPSHQPEIASDSIGTSVDYLTEEQKVSFQALEAYLLQQDRTLDYERAMKDPAIPQEVLDDFAAGLETQGWEIKASPSDLARIQEKAIAIAPAMANLRAACGGRNGLQPLPPAVLLNSCAASAVQNAYASGAGAAAIAAIITAQTGAGPLLAGTIAGILTISSGLIGLCNSWGQGVKIFATGGCWSQ